MIEELKAKILERETKRIEKSYLSALEKLSKSMEDFPKVAKTQLKNIKNNKWTFYITTEEWDQMSISFRTKSQEDGYVNDHFTAKEQETLNFIFSTTNLILPMEIVECTFPATDEKSLTEHLISLGLMKGTPSW